MIINPKFKVGDTVYTIHFLRLNQDKHIILKWKITTVNINIYKDRITVESIKIKRGKKTNEFYRSRLKAIYKTNEQADKKAKELTIKDWKSKIKWIAKSTKRNQKDIIRDTKRIEKIKRKLANINH